MNRKILAAAVAAGAGLGAAGWVYSIVIAPKVQTGANGQVAAGAPAEANFPGKLRAAFVVDVAPPQPGQVAAFFVDVNEEVTEGQLLARVSAAGIDQESEAAGRAIESIQERINTIESGVIAARLEASRARAEASRARAEYDRTERAHRRQQMLYGEGATPKLQMEKAQRDYELAKAEFDALEQVAQRADERVSQLMKDVESQKRILEEKNADAEQLKTKTEASEIYSPVTGMVVGRKGEIGDIVGPDKTDFLQIATRLNELEVEFTPDPATLARVKAGQDALVIAAGVGDGLPGKVKEVAGTQVVVSFANPNPGIRPGGTAQVRIRLQ